MKQKKEKRKDIKQGSLFKKLEKSKNKIVKRMNWKIIKTITKDGEIIHKPASEVYLIYIKQKKNK